MRCKYIQAAVVKLSADGKYMGNILQPHNTPLSVHQMKQVFYLDETVWIKGLTNSAIKIGKLLALKWWVRQTLAVSDIPV